MAVRAASQLWPCWGRVELSLSAKHSEAKSDPVRLLTALLPSLLTLLGVGGLESAGIVNIRDRYQWAADLLVWISVLGCVVAIVAASYPYLRQPPFNMLVDRPQQWLEGRRERRAFQRWIGRWLAFDGFMFRALPSPKLWADLQVEYARLRAELAAHQGELSRLASKHVRWHLGLQWEEELTVCEKRIGENAGLSTLSRRETLKEQAIDILMGSYYWGGNKEVPVPVVRVFRGVWDGLNDYSVKRGWGTIGDPIRTPVDDENESADG